MDKELICIDTSILIDYYRKKRKEKSEFYKLSEKYKFAISAITKFEIICGANQDQVAFWDSLLGKFEFIPINNNEIDIAVAIYKDLLQKNKIIGIKDILIASSALSLNLKMATLNLKDFKRITNLELIELN